MVSAAVAGTTFRPLRSYTTLWDVTNRQATRICADTVLRSRRTAFGGPSSTVTG